MDVTSENFENVLPQIQFALNNADFVAFDLEFSGLGREEQRSTPLDNYEERYQKLANTVRDFGMFQVGFSFFCYEPSQEKYDTSTFTFNLFKETARQERAFTSNVSSIRFLANEGFDFNKVFKHGISYVNMEELEKLQKDLPRKIKRRQGVDSRNDTHLNSDDIQVYRMIKKFILDKKPKKSKNNEIIALVPDYLSELNVTKFELPPHSSCFTFSGDSESLRGKLMQEFNNIEIVANKWKQTFTVTVFADQKSRDKFITSDVVEKFNTSVGFTKVFLDVLASKIPLVGHNPVYDILHLLDKMVQPLPHHLSQFQSLYQTNIKHLYDTKVVVSCTKSLIIKHSSLGEVYERSIQHHLAPRFDTYPGHLSYSTSGANKCHDAGYDAFMTGCAFATMLVVQNGETFTWESELPVRDYNHIINMGSMFGTTQLNLRQPAKLDRVIFKLTADSPLDYFFMNSFFLGKRMKFVTDAEDNNISYCSVAPNEIDFSKADINKVINMLKQNNIQTSRYNSSPVPEHKKAEFQEVDIFSLLRIPGPNTMSENDGYTDQFEVPNVVDEPVVSSEDLGCPVIVKTSKTPITVESPDQTYLNGSSKRQMDECAANTPPRKVIKNGSHKKKTDASPEMDETKNVTDCNIEKNEKKEEADGKVEDNKPEDILNSKDVKDSKSNFKPEKYILEKKKRKSTAELEENDEKQNVQSQKSKDASSNQPKASEKPNKRQTGDTRQPSLSPAPTSLQEPECAVATSPQVLVGHSGKKAQKKSPAHNRSAKKTGRGKTTEPSGSPAMFEKKKDSWA